ncbi:MAG TPA: LPXTG cell wall anchor domain-containing protein [Acidimicrobiia bacterium]
MTLVGVPVLIGAFLFGLGSAGATTPNYPPKAKTDAAAAAKTTSTTTDPTPSAVATQAAPLPFTGGNSSELVWAGGALLVAGGALVGRGRRRAVRR